jgi:hypothetical protein
MKKKTLSVTFEEVFDFLKKDFNFYTISSKDEDWGYSYEGKNKTTGIKITYEFTEAYINIMLYKLVDNEIVENTVSAIKGNKQINGFSLDLFVQVRNPDSIIKPAYEYGVNSEYYLPDVGLKNYAMLYANNLKQHATDVLNGDFSMFPQIEKIVKNKYKDYYK